MAFNKGAGSAAAPNDDSDLEDLIAKSPGKIISNVEIDSSPVLSSSSGGGGFLSATPLGFIAGGCRLFCYQCPGISKCVLSLIVMGCLAFLTNTIFNPAQKMGIMGGDYSAITSAYDLSLSKVDHWCIQGDNDSCKCEDPLEPNSRSEFKSWNAAHKSNVADVNLYRALYDEAPTLIEEGTGKTRPPIDVAFLGESVVEAMDGRWLGKRVVKALSKSNGREGPEGKRKPDIGEVFERMFRKEKGGPLEGLALGIAGDNTANVLWRLQHDEMPYDFNPKVWWLVLGMNDLTRMQCSEEIVVLGILRVVEEIRFRKPDAKIVINSLLPMVDFQAFSQPKMSDFADFRIDAKNKMRGDMEADKAMKRIKEEKKEKDYKRGNGRRQLRSKEQKMSKKSKKRDRGRRHEGKDDATEGAELQEAMDRRKKYLAARDKRIRDRTFKDREKYHPKKPVSPFLPMLKKRVMPPVWPSVHLINAKLKEFCSKHESITFFDATDIFASNEGGGNHHLKNELISPRGHPSELGFAFWESKMIQRLYHMIGDAPKEKVPKPEEIEEISPFSEVSQPSSDLVEDSADVVKGSGDGSEHVSDGKESGPPPKVDQPSRSAPGKEKETVSARGEKRGKENKAGDAEDSGDGAEQVSSGKASNEKAGQAEDKPTSSTKNKKAKDDDADEDKQQSADAKVVGEDDEGGDDGDAEESDTEEKE